MLPAGLVLNATLGWSWADPIAGLVIAAVALREGVETWQGEQCDDCSPALDDACDDPCCATTEEHR